MHRVLIEPTNPPQSGDVFEVDGDEAKHVAKARRATEGDAIQAVDGAGLVARGVIASINRHRRGGVGLSIDIESVEHEPRPKPCIDVWSASPKGERLSHMIEELSEVGASSW